MTLTEIANRLELDKGTADASTLSWHAQFPDHKTMGYTEVYEQFMADRRNEPVRIFEVGVCDQRFPLRSVRMWREYFPNGQIVTLDKFVGHAEGKADYYCEELRKLGVTPLVGDQGTAETYDQLAVEPFDFIIEDGSHLPEHMMFSLFMLCQRVATGGFYFMEDIQNPLTTKGMFGYDNTKVLEELQEFQATGVLKSCFLTENQCAQITRSLTLMALFPCLNQFGYLAVFTRL